MIVFCQQLLREVAPPVAGRYRRRKRAALKKNKAAPLQRNILAQLTGDAGHDKRRAAAW